MSQDEVVLSPPDASIDDLEALRDLWCQMQSHQIEVAHHEQLNRDLELGWGLRKAWYLEELAKGGAIVRARRGGQLVGYCALSVQLHPDETFSAVALVTVITLSVAEGERGRGVGSRLLDAAEAFARSQGADTLCLEVMPGNDRARALYERLGFEPVEIRMHRPITPLR